MTFTIHGVIILVILAASCGFVVGLLIGVASDEDEVTNDT